MTPEQTNNLERIIGTIKDLLEDLKQEAYNYGWNDGYENGIEDPTITNVIPPVRYIDGKQVPEGEWQQYHESNDKT